MQAVRIAAAVAKKTDESIRLAVAVASEAAI
jgi:hypothetical protein